MRGNEFEDYCRILWRGALENEGAFRHVMLTLVGECQDYQRRGELRELERILRQYYWAEPYCHSEPLLTAYEHGSCLLSLVLADAAANLRDFAAVYELTGKIQELLADGDQRRRELGLAERPNSEIHCHLLRLLADCKWQDPDPDCRDAVTPAGDMVVDFAACHGRILGYLDAHPERDAARNKLLLETVQWTAYALAKFARRFLPDQALNLVQRFNRRYSPHLAAATGHFRRAEPLSDSVFYWDFELTKLWLDHSLTWDDLTWLHAERLRAWGGATGGSDASFRRGLELETAYMKRHCQRNLKVVKNA